MIVTLQGSASLLSYAPRSQMDYGTVLCRAANLVGRQVVPCVYHVIPAGKSERNNRQSHLFLPHSIY